MSFLRGGAATAILLLPALLSVCCPAAAAAAFVRPSSIATRALFASSSSSSAASRPVLGRLPSFSVQQQQQQQQQPPRRGLSSMTSSGGSGTTATAATTEAAAKPRIGDGVTKRLTLLFVRRANPQTGAREVLLGMKKRGFGEGKWNGFGGKVEPGETVEAAALRELREEACLTAAKAELRGRITFTFLTIPDVLHVHVYEAVGPIEGEPQETEEMRPQWYSEQEIPYDKMWADDQYWLPVFLEGKRFRALFEFDDESTILRHELRALADDEALEPFAG